MKRWQRIVGIGAAALLALCIGLAMISFASNQYLPQAPASLDRLSDIDKARLAEALHLKQTLGDQIWPGWGKADIPVILWNHDYSFLFGAPNPPPEWERVPSDSFAGASYFRQRTAEHQNFAVHLDDHWAACMATKWETDAFLMTMFRELLPPVVRDIFPYRLVIQPSEVQMTGLLHESFHAFQYGVAPGQMEAAEAAHKNGDRYWDADAKMRAEWQAEIGLLARAVSAETTREARELTRQFLDRRKQRRMMHALDAELIAYEQQLEWEEGLAKYVELESWQSANASPEYVPLAEMKEDPDFQFYCTFDQRKAQEIDQMQRQAGQEGEVRLYYTGMAQAFLLDRLAPGWKADVLTGGAWLETRLEVATRAIDPCIPQAYNLDRTNEREADVR